MRFLTAAALVLTFSAAVRAIEVPLTVEEPVGAARSAEVVSGGIPLPEGVYKDPAAFSLAGGVPVQVSPIVKYPDGSLHWVLVSFPVKLGANEKKTFTLKDAAGSAKPANPVTVKEDGNKVTVSNGLVSFTLDRASFNGFESVTYQGKKVFQAAEAALVANGKGGPGKLTHFEYRYKGPVRTTLYLKGTYGGEKAPTWAMAVTLNAGESAIHIDHNLRNAAVGAKHMTVKAPELRLGLAGKLKAAGGGVAPQTGRRRGKPAYGWKTFSGDADVLVFLRHGAAGAKFTPAYRAAVEGGRLVVPLSGGEGSDYWLAYGAHKITEIDLAFGKSASPEALAEPLHALAPSAWYAEHDGLGVGKGFGSLEDEAQGAKNLGYTLKGNPPAEKANPNIFKSWLDTHGTSEADQIRGLTLAYVRSGQRGFLDRAAAWVRYYRNYYYWRSDDFVWGKEGSHNVGKWVPGRLCACHGYGVGMFNYALLTGNVDALEVAFDAAEHAAAIGAGRKPGDNYSWWGSRGFVRMFNILARAYEVARTPEWEKALAHYARVELETSQRDPRGFINHGIISTWTKKKLDELKSAKRGSPDAVALYEKEGTQIGEKGICKHPKYGQWHPRCVGTWPEAIASMGNYMAYRALAKSKDPAVQVVAEDAQDFCIAEAQFGRHWAYDPHLKQMYYYFYTDFPIPGYVPLWKGGRWGKPHRETALNGWYTTWWPDGIARGYALTGERAFLESAMEVWAQGRNRGYWTLPKAEDNEVAGYAGIEWNHKGDWVSPSVLTFGLAAHPRKDGTPPKAITDLKAKAVGGQKVELTWTSPADEGGGRTVRYQVKWAHQPILDYPRTGEDWRKAEYWRDKKNTFWNIATNVAGEPSPQPAGRSEKTVVTVERGKCFFAVRSFDDSHNRSAMSNVVGVEVQ